MQNDKFNFKTMQQQINNLPETSTDRKVDTIPKVLGIENKENYINNWLSFLLDSSRYSSVEPLNVLMELYAKKECSESNVGKNIDLTVAEDEEIEVTREATLDNGRRIDILIETEKLLIGIENKIHSGLQQNQLEDYTHSINNLIKKTHEGSKRPILILLTPKSNKSFESGDFLHIWYEELADKLSELKYDYLNNLRNAFLLEDFVNYVNEYLRKDESSMNEEWAKFLGSNSKELRTIFEEGKKNLGLFIEDIGNQLDTAFQNEDKEWDTLTYKNTSTQFWRQLNNPEWEKFNLHYEIGTVEQTQGFILPTKLRLSFDMESKVARDYFQSNDVLTFHGDKKDIKGQNPINYFTVDYTNENTIKSDLKKIISELKAWDDKHRNEIENAVNEMNKNDY